MCFIKLVLHINHLFKYYISFVWKYYKISLQLLKKISLHFYSSWQAQLTLKQKATLLDLHWCDIPKNKRLDWKTVAYYIIIKIHEN